MKDRRYVHAYVICEVSEEDVLPHASNLALHRYPTVHRFVTEMCTDENISVTKWCIVERKHNSWTFGDTAKHMCVYGTVSPLPQRMLTTGPWDKNVHRHVSQNTEALF